VVRLAPWTARRSPSRIVGVEGAAVAWRGPIAGRAVRLAGVLLAAAAFAVTAAGLAFMVLDWSTPVPAGYFGSDRGR
jgi:hypothetical protein